MNYRKLFETIEVKVPLLIVGVIGVMVVMHVIDGGLYLLRPSEVTKAIYELHPDIEADAADRAMHAISYGALVTQGLIAAAYIALAATLYRGSRLARVIATAIFSLLLLGLPVLLGGSNNVIPSARPYYALEQYMYALFEVVALILMWGPILIKKYIYPPPDPISKYSKPPV